MFDDRESFLSRALLKREFALDYKAWSPEDDAAILLRLQAWDARSPLRETQAESAFIQTFFVELWGYGESGRVDPADHTLIPKYGVPGEGAEGGMGEADLAAGWFRGRTDATPQLLCEFKDIRSGLEARQNRKGNRRSPIEQCLNYVRGARRGLFGNEAVLPWWGLVTDMNEFRLYWWDRAPQQFLRFTITRQSLFSGEYDLLSNSEEARFDRFLFTRLFHRNALLSQGGRPYLLRLIEKQWAKEKALDKDFYARYSGVREALYNTLVINNPGFPKSKGELLRLAQKLLDRFIFTFYCEDMGERLLFPPQLISDLLKQRSLEHFYDPAGSELWTLFKTMFRHLQAGGSDR